MCLFLAAMGMSFLLHSGLAALCLQGAGNEPQKEPSMFIQLISHRIVTSQAPEPERTAGQTPSGRTGPQSSKPAEPPAGQRRDGSKVEIESKPAATPLSEPVQDASLRKALKRIQKKIIPHWNKADPPGIGSVEVRMELDKRGTIRSLWITSLQGPPELGDFIAGLIRRASPFPDAVGHAEGALVLDCAFNVTGSTMETSAAGAD